MSVSSLFRRMDMGRHVGSVGGDVPGGQVESSVGQESNRIGTWGWVRADSNKWFIVSLASARTLKSRGLSPKKGLKVSPRSTLAPLVGFSVL